MPKELPRFGALLERARIEPGEKSAAALGVDRVVSRKELPAFLTRRQEAPGLLLYTAGLAEGGHGFPLDIALDDPQAAWNHAMEELWPTGRLKSADPILEQMRLVKSPAEIEALRTTGAASARALRAGLSALPPGRSAARRGRRRRVRLPRRRRRGAVVLAVGHDGPGERVSGALRIPRRLPASQPHDARG